MRSPFPALGKSVNGKLGDLAKKSRIRQENSHTGLYRLVTKCVDVDDLPDPVTGGRRSCPPIYSGRETTDVQCGPLEYRPVTEVREKQSMAVLLLQAEATAAAGTRETESLLPLHGWPEA